jgi:DNA invertase Pin-like site-specific DNA recombinase
MIYHYCRVSTREQSLERQFSALNAYKPADKVFTDRQSGKDFLRDGYQMLKSEVKAGDEVVIKELDRLGRNKDEIKSELEWFKNNGIIIRILDIPTTLIEFQGQQWVADMINNILIEVIGTIAEQERLKIRQRQKEGYDALRASGEWDKLGRPKVDIDMAAFKKFRKKQKSGQMTVEDCCNKLNLSRSSWYRLIKEI